MPRREFRRFDPSLPIEQASTPPYTWYTSGDVLLGEKEEIFEKCWMAVGRASQVARPGDYFTGEIVGNPYVVVRGEDGELRAFHNVCRHHAAMVAQQAGSCQELVCPYHGWAYRLDGSLRRAPHMGRMEHFDPSAYGLKPAAVATWGPFIFVDLDGPWGGRNNPRDLERDIAPLHAALAPLGMEHLRWVQRRVYDMRCNWKVFVDNALDGGYHVAYAHETLAEGLAFAGYRTQIHDRSVIQLCETQGTDSRLGSQVAYAWLFPNFFINRYGRMMDTNLVLPLSVDSCRVIFDFYFDYENLEEWTVQKLIQKSIDASESIQEEDIAVCESAQRGMSSMSYECGRYSSLLERGVHAFHVLLWKELLGRAA